MNLIELDHALRKLRLSGMAAVLETRLRQAQTNPEPTTASRIGFDNAADQHDSSSRAPDHSAGPRSLSQGCQPKLHKWSAAEP